MSGHTEGLREPGDHQLVMGSKEKTKSKELKNKESCGVFCLFCFVVVRKENKLGEGCYEQVSEEEGQVVLCGRRSS